MLIYNAKTKTEEETDDVIEISAEELMNIEKQRLREWRQPYLNILDRATWFYSLTDEQKAEAVSFRQALLDITVTLEKPIVPSFININYTDLAELTKDFAQE